VTVTTYNTPALAVSLLSIDFGLEQTSKSVDLTNTGAPGSVLSWSLAIDQSTAQWLSSSQTSGATTSADTITLSIDREELIKGPYSGQVIISSNGGNENISVSMSVPNHPPEIISTFPRSITIGTLYTCDVEATDPDQDALTYSLVTAPSGMSIDPGTGVISWTPSLWGSDQVTVSVTDGECIVEQSFKISVEGGGSIDENTVLYSARSPYIVKYSLFVSEGFTLTIAPGVELRFDKDKGVQVDGTLIASGTKEAEIVFTSNESTPASGDWGYIYFSDKSTEAYFNDGDYVDGSILEHCVVEYAGGVSATNNAAVRVYDAYPFINYSTIINNKAPGIFAWSLSDTLNISNNTISSNDGYGIEIHGYYIISNNIISNNTGGIKCSTYGSGGSYSIFHNIIKGNTGYGISCRDCTVNISNNIISNNAGGIVNSNVYPENNTTLTLAKNAIINNTQDAWDNSILYISSAGYYDSININNNLITGNLSSKTTCIHMRGTSYSPTYPVKLNHNNIFNNINGTDENYDVYNNTDSDSFTVDAENNWWGVTNKLEIQAKIYDFGIDSSKSIVDFDPWLEAINIDSPISPPTGFTVTEINEAGVNLAWAANPEADTAGYKIYYDAYTRVDPPYNNVVNVPGKNTTSFVLDPPAGQYYITITAYDTLADGEEDLFEGHESWYADGLSATVAVTP